MKVDVSDIKWVIGRPRAFQVGMIVEDVDGNYLLIGDANENGGCCDCCPIIDLKHVKRYCQLDIGREGRKFLNGNIQRGTI